MKGNPSRGAEPVDNFIIIAGGVAAGTKVKSEEMDGYTHHQQQGGNPLQEPRPETPFFNVHFLYRPIKSSLVKIDSKGIFFLSIFSLPPSWRSTRVMALTTFRLDSLARSMASIVD